MENRIHILNMITNLIPLFITFNIITHLIIIYLTLYLYSINIDITYMIVI